MTFTAFIKPLSVAAKRLRANNKLSTVVSGVAFKLKGSVYVTEALSHDDVIALQPHEHVQMEIFTGGMSQEARDAMAAAAGDLTPPPGADQGKPGNQPKPGKNK